MHLDRGPLEMGVRTGNWAAAKVAVLLIAIAGTSCSPRQPGQAYILAWADYVNGNLREAAEESHRESVRWQTASTLPWHWKFRLLEAEALWAQSKKKEAERL